MNMFLWKEDTHLTSNYHSGGGLIIFAESTQEAKEEVKRLTTEDRWGDSRLHPKYEWRKPDLVLTVQNQVKAQTMIFPDKGCC